MTVSIAVNRRPERDPQLVTAFAAIGKTAMHRAVKSLPLT